MTSESGNKWEAVERLYQAAYARPVSERAAFLDEACSGDTRLRQEVDSLLAQPVSTDGFLEAPVLTVAASAKSPMRDGLMSGRWLGVYQIQDLLGAGGMGEVYRARDTKLGREVAIKVLPKVFTSDPERLARFEREARVLAALNHPHIGAIYGFEENGDVHALILELVDGPTLAERLVQGPLGAVLAVEVAMQIADALEAAHERGIIHRDVKPANIKISATGVVKVLDFGLAKAAIGDGSGSDLSRSPTMRGSDTQDGVLLGTPAYVSPEQARGKPADKRADIWSFGCVLYEVLTGRAAFQGDTVSDTMTAVLERAPDWSELPDTTPANIRRLLRHCLEKDPARRLRDIGDARLALEEKAEPVIAQAPTRDARWQYATAILALLATVLGGWWWATLPVSDVAALRLPVELGPEAVDPVVGASAIISPDGRRLVYRGRDASGTLRLFTRLLDQDATTLLPGTDDAVSPFFSPDGRSVGFFARGKLKTISVQGGNPIDLCSTQEARGGSWGEDNNIIASLEARGPLYRIPSDGGQPQRITELRGAVTHRWPQVLPGGRTMIFTSNDFIGDFDRATIEIQSLVTGQRTTLLRGGYYGRYAQSGHLLYLRDGTVFAQRVDVERQELVGPAVPVLSDVRTRVPSGGAALDMSQTGTLIYAAGVPLKRRLAWLDATGRVEPLRVDADASDRPIRFSPDGDRLVLTKTEAGSNDVWAYELRRGVWTRLTTSPDFEGFAVWSPDGAHIAFSAFTAGSEEGGSLSWKRADGTGVAVHLTTNGNPRILLQPRSFSPDGKWLVFEEVSPETRGDVRALPVDDAQSDHPTTGKPISLVQTGFNELAPMVSPDGRWLAYQSDETGTERVYVQSFPETGGRWPVSTAGGSDPVWAKQGQELFYRSSQGMMVVSYKVTGAIFQPATPRLWVAKTDLTPSFDLSPDGQRFIISENDTSEESPQSAVTFVLNFFDELRRLSSTGR